jgi:hypothetical protein
MSIFIWTFTKNEITYYLDQNGKRVTKDLTENDFYTVCVEAVKN